MKFRKVRLLTHHVKASQRDCVVRQEMHPTIPHYLCDSVFLW